MVQIRFSANLFLLENSNMFLFQSNLPTNKAVAFALKKIYSVNNHFAFAICCFAGINPNTRLSDLNASQSESLVKICTDFIDTHAYRRDLESMKRLISNNTYRGQRLIQAKPCRGQRTRTNASSVKRHLSKLRTRLKTLINV